MTTGPDQKPPLPKHYGEDYERGLDPWHPDAAPPGFEVAFAAMSGTEKRKEGWYLLDHWKNVIGWVPDGTEFPDELQTKGEQAP